MSRTSYGLFIDSQLHGLAAAYGFRVVHSLVSIHHFGLKAPELWPILLAGVDLQRNAAQSHKKPIRIFLVDDDEFMLEVVGKLLRHEPDRYEVIGEVRDAETAIVQCAKHCPDLMLLDINLPGRSGLEAVADVRKLCPSTRILLCTAYATDERILAGMRSGAHGFVEKTRQWSDLAEAIERVAAGEFYLCARSSAALAYHSQRADAAQTTHLTTREREVMQLVGRGKSSKEIATELSVSVATVDVHRSNLMKKLGVNNIAALVIAAFKSGLLLSAASAE